MGITNSNKTISADKINCDGSLMVTLSLTGAPDIINNPTDIALVLDRSGSMAGVPLKNMKLGANTFIDIIQEATNPDKDGQIGSSSRIGIVSFAATAVQNTQLITSVETLKNAVNSLSAAGSTNHADAFTKAMELFDPQSSNTKVIVLFTDGNTTTGGAAAPIAEEAKKEGIIIYCIGLIGSDGLNVDALNEWASDPDAAHVAITPDADDLEELFSELAANISKPGATNIVIDETVNPDFMITGVISPNKGSATMISSNSIKWSISKLGVSAEENAILKFFIRHISEISGIKHVNQSISYTDTEGNLVKFPDPTVEVTCDIVVTPEECPVAVDFETESCCDSLVIDLGDVYLESTGCIIQMDVTLKNVCPHKRVALAAILTEEDEYGTEYQRGMKTITVPAHNRSQCHDVLVKGIKFVVPDNLDVSTAPPSSMCNQRKFKARFIANNIDTDFFCSESMFYL